LPCARHLGLAGTLKGFTIAVEGKRTLGGGDLDRCLVIPRERAFLDGTIRRAVDEL